MFVYAFVLCLNTGLYLLSSLEFVSVICVLCCTAYRFALFIVLVVRPVVSADPNYGSATVFAALIVSEFSLVILLGMNYTRIQIIVRNVVHEILKRNP
jgi:predicted MFS family arabinose efflux permease